MNHYLRIFGAVISNLIMCLIIALNVGISKMGINFLLNSLLLFNYCLKAIENFNFNELSKLEASCFEITLQ